MGVDKALLKFDRLTFIQHVTRTMHEVFNDLLIISDKWKTYEFLKIPVVPDIYKNCGPLGGIHAAFHHSTASALFVVSCDTPFISRELIGHIIGYEGDAEVKIPSEDSSLHPLCGFYTRGCLPVIEMNLNKQCFKVQDIFHQLKTLIIPITPELQFYTKELFLNFNNPADIQMFGITRPC